MLSTWKLAVEIADKLKRLKVPPEVIWKIIKDIPFKNIDQAVKYVKNILRIL